MLDSMIGQHVLSGHILFSENISLTIDTLVTLYCYFLYFNMPLK